MNFGCDRAWNHNLLSYLGHENIGVVTLSHELSDIATVSYIVSWNWCLHKFQLQLPKLFQPIVDWLPQSAILHQSIMMLSLALTLTGNYLHYANSKTLLHSFYQLRLMLLLLYWCHLGWEALSFWIRIWRVVQNWLWYKRKEKEGQLRPLRSKDNQCWILRMRLWSFIIISECLAANLKKVRQISVWQTVP